MTRFPEEQLPLQWRNKKISAVLDTTISWHRLVEVFQEICESPASFFALMVKIEKESMAYDYSAFVLRLRAPGMLVLGIFEDLNTTEHPNDALLLPYDEKTARIIDPEEWRHSYREARRHGDAIAAVLIRNDQRTGRQAREYEGFAQALLRGPLHRIYEVR